MIERVDRIDPRLPDPPERRRRGTRPFPEIDGEKPAREEPDAPRKPSRDHGDDEERLVDVLVRGRLLPTLQILPGPASAAPPF